jgi:membrane-bound lytic murein transglycosylase B
MISTGYAASTTFAQRPDVQQFIDMMVKNYGFNKTALTQVFNQVQEQPAIVAGMSTTKEQLPWYKYRAIFITQQRIDQGVAFWKQHQQTLNTVAKQDGVDPSVIVAILGVETYYGKNQGNYRVIDSLSTLAFDYPARAKFFQHELQEFLLLTRENNMNPLLPKGSYAGAIGQPQFMPSSYRAYAIDFGNTGSKDLQNSPDDVIASVSNYFKHHGWQANQPVATLTKVQGKNYQQLSNKVLKPEFTLAQLAQHGVTPIGSYSPTLKANFMALDMADAQQQYWLGFNNFYVITRYNPRINYAMAVYQLSQAIKAQYQKTA